MDPIHVVIDQKAVEEQVVQAITESAIGERLEEAINEALKKPERYGADTLIVSAVKEVVRQTIRGRVAEMLLDNEEFKARLRVVVEEETTDDVLRTLISHLYAFND